MAKRKPTTAEIVGANGQNPALAPRVEPKLAGIPFDWAANKLKLNLAHKHVAETQPELTVGSKEHEAAVKDRYVTLKGMLASEVQIRRNKTPKSNVVNLSADDGSPDDDE